jgi:hypothetical protein
MILLFPALIKAQNGEKIVSKLKSVNDSLVSKSCDSADAAAISNRAMNVFLSDVTGYLSSKTDLSYFTNYVTYNTAESKLTVNHNFQKASGADEPLKKLFSIGLSISIPNNYAASFLDYKHETGLGFMLGYKWLGKVKTHFADCGTGLNMVNQKQKMDALRTGIVNSLAVEIKNKEIDFENALNEIRTADLNGLQPDSATAIIRQEFYNELNEKADEKFATLQAVTLTETKNFSLISTHWTGIHFYLPVFSSKHDVAPTVTENFQQKKSYPLELILSHTRLWESSKTGRFFATFGTGILLNNSKLSYNIENVGYSEYKNLGGIDNQHDEALKSNKAYIGNYGNFVTPSAQFRLVYFPVEYHLGISILVQQNFGKYNFLNSRIGIPVVLINSKKTPAIDFEFYVSLTDITNQSETKNTPENKTFVGMSLGIPLSRLMY